MRRLRPGVHLRQLRSLDALRVGCARPSGVRAPLRVELLIAHRARPSTSSMIASERSSALRPCASAVPICLPESAYAPTRISISADRPLDAVPLENRSHPPVRDPTRLSVPTATMSSAASRRVRVSPLATVDETMIHVHATWISSPSELGHLWRGRITVTRTGRTIPPASITRTGTRKSRSLTRTRTTLIPTIGTHTPDLRLWRGSVPPPEPAPLEAHFPRMPREERHRSAASSMLGRIPRHMHARHLAAIHAWHRVGCRWFRLLRRRSSGFGPDWSG